MSSISKVDFWNKRTGADLLKSIEYFNQAISKDPNYALAYAGLADSYLLLSLYGAISPGESFPQARAAAEKALELDNTLAEAHASLGLLACFEFDLNRSITELERAIQLNRIMPRHITGFRVCPSMDSGSLIARLQKENARSNLIRCR
jgi:tetratricopeptide (TPR) repeat protein